MDGGPNRACGWSAGDPLQLVGSLDERGGELACLFAREVVTILDVDVERPLRRTVPRLYRRELHRRVEPVHRAGAPLQIVGPVALAAVVPVARVLGAVGQR